MLEKRQALGTGIAVAVTEIALQREYKPSRQRMKPLGAIGQFVKFERVAERRYRHFAQDLVIGPPVWHDQFVAGVISEASAQAYYIELVALFVEIISGRNMAG